MSGLLLRSLQRGLDPNSTAKSGVPLLQYCMSQLMRRPVEYILENGGRTNFCVVVNEQRMSLLMYGILLDFEFGTHYFSLLVKYNCSLIRDEQCLLVLINNMNSISMLVSKTTQAEHLRYSLTNLQQLLTSIDNLTLIANQVVFFCSQMAEKYNQFSDETQKTFFDIFHRITLLNVNISAVIATLSSCPKYLALACR